MEGAAQPAVNRALHHAILLSLALHGVILFGLSVERETARRASPPVPIEARLVEPPAPPQPPPAVRSEPLNPSQVEKPSPQAKPPRLVKRQPRPKPAPVTKPAPAPEPAPQAAPSKPAAEPVEPVEPVEPTPVAPAQPSAEQIEALTRDQYRLQVLDAARSHNRYPPLARENNWEGQVRVRMEIGADGRVSVAVEKSSGHPVLDRQAVEMFRRAQAQVPVPPSLRGKALSFELRAIYNLKDQGSG